MMVRELGFEHLGQKVRWVIPEDAVLVEETTPWGILEWLQHGPGECYLGVTFYTPRQEGDRPEYAAESAAGEPLTATFWEGSFRPDFEIELERVEVDA